MVDASTHPLGVDRAALDRIADDAVFIDLGYIVDRGTMAALADCKATVCTAGDVIRERAAQDLKWGQSNHPSLPADVKHPCAFFGIPTADAARLHCETAFRTGTGSNAHILLEEVSEAIEAANDPVHLRAELVQVAAVALKWIEQLDRRAAADNAEVTHG
ncbi:MAG: hypothetical protein ACTHJ9_05305 [Rhodanobacter sp.]